MLTATARDARPTPLARLPRTTAAALVIAALDSIGILEHSTLGYGAVAIGLVITAMLDSRRDIPRGRISPTGAAVSILLAILLIYLVIIAIDAGRFAQDTFIIVYGAGLLVLLEFSYVALRARPNRRKEVAWVPLAAGLFGTVTLIDGVLTLSGGSPNTGLSHERIFLAIWAFTLVPERRWRLVRVLLVAAMALSLLRYASATSVIAIGTAFFVALLLKSRNRFRATTLLIVSIAVMMVALPSLSRLVDDFYVRFGRVNNTTTREGLWRQASDILEANPFFGGRAQASITGLANIDGRIQLVPFHNTLLTVGTVGGWIAVGLLVLLIAIALFRGLLAVGSERQRAATWLPALASGLACISVNPVLEKPGTAVAFYVLIFVALLRFPEVDRSRVEP
ncbi:O-antigen ligase family protein [Microbacterium sp. GXF7504]